MSNIFPPDFSLFVSKKSTKHFQCLEIEQRPICWERFAFPYTTGGGGNGKYQNTKKMRENKIWEFRSRVIRERPLNTLLEASRIVSLNDKEWQSSLRAWRTFSMHEAEFAFPATVLACLDGIRGEPARRPARGLVRPASWQRRARAAQRRYISVRVPVWPEIT